MKLYVLTLFAALMMAQPALAQPHPPDRREQVKKRIRNLRAVTLTEKLALDPTTQTRLWPVLEKYDNQTDVLVARRVEVFRRLGGAGGMSPRQVNDLIDEALNIQKSFRLLEDNRLAEIRQILTPKQIAKLLVVLPEFERRIQNQLRRAIVNQTGGAQKGNGEEDDDVEPDEAPPPRR
jgi:Spy/CpxP family protein refolding chaperone